jgi:16S rRNA (cytosine1402-N4)-methyltransferase
MSPTEIPSLPGHKPLWDHPMPSKGTCHRPVMLDEIVDWLQPSPGKVLVDGTLGGGGHSAALAQRIGPEGRVIGIDLDQTAIDRAMCLLHGLPVELVIGNFCNLPEILDSLGLEAVDGIILDLGLSSDQLADTERGFSFQATGPLDLRFDTTRGEPAWRLLGRLSEKHLADLIFKYGEERCSRRIARKILERRRKDPIRTASDLAELVRRTVPRGRASSIDPATRTFQALRIAVNDEIASLEAALTRLPGCLRSGGRLAVLSFHSLEDRPVKHAFREDIRLEVLTRKPLRPTEFETGRNARARSAKLRVAQRIADM